MVLIFLLSGMMGVGTTRGEDTASSDTSDQARESRSEEIKKELEKVAILKRQKDVKAVPGIADPEPSGLKKSAEESVSEKDILSSKNSSRGQEPQPGEAERKQPEKGGASGKKETAESVQGSEKQEQVPSGEKAPEASPEENRFDYAVLENVTWETSGKKVVLRLWISGKATPVVNMIRDQHGMKMRLRPKGLATRMRHTLSTVPPGVRSFSIRDDPKLAKVWELEAPYYAVEEIQALFAFPVQFSLHQEPGLLKVIFSFPKKIEPKKIEPTPVPVETIKTMQREALGSPETTLGTSYQSQMQLEDRILYGPQKPPSVTDLYKKQRENAEFRAASGLPEDVRPIFDAMHPPFGSAEYFKKYVHGSIRQSFNYTTDYNDGTTSAFGENSAERGEPGSGGNSGKDIGNILWTPAIALLFYRPGPFDISTGYSASRDFPMMRNNFIYGLNRQNVNLGIGHYSKKRYAFAMQNNLGITGGTTRQKVGSKWVKASSQTQEGYQSNNNFGLNYRLSKRLLWGSGAGISSQWLETPTTGVRNQTLTGRLNTYLQYRVTHRLDLLLGTDFTHVYKDTGLYQELTSTSTSVTTKGNNLQSVFLNASYRYSKKLILTGGIQGSLIDWDIGKFGGSVGITYKRTPYDELSFQYANSVVQNNTAMILARSVNTANGFGLSLQRIITMGLRYNRQFDHGKTRGFLEVRYLKQAPLSGVFYGGTGGSSTINYDIRFTASIRRAILKDRASLGLLYSYEFAPNRMRNDVTGEHDLTSNTSQNIIASMDYNF